MTGKTPPAKSVESLAVLPLTKAAFAPYGAVIETAGAVEIPINQGTTTRYNALAAVDVAAQGGVASISVFRGTRRPDPIEIHLMERHPLGSQAFMPLQPFASIARPSRPPALTTTPQ